MRDKVLTIRVTREQYEAIKLFAQAGLAASHSEASARRPGSAPRPVRG